MNLKDLPRVVPLLKLPGVLDEKNLGPWDAFTVSYTSTGKTRWVSRDLTFGVRHISQVERFVCAACLDTWPNRNGAETHRKDVHGSQPNGGYRQPVGTDPVATERAAPAALARPEPEQMTIDEIGLDLAGPALVEGVAAIVASRANARQRAKDLERENDKMRAMLEKIKTLLEEL